MTSFNKILTVKLPPKLTGIRVSVLGLARSGVAVSQLLHRQGAQVLVSDSGTNALLKTQAEELRKVGIEVEIGEHSARVLEADLIVRSPGVPNSNPILNTARQKGIAVASEIEVASWYCRAPIVAITGSNGKTTTTEWLGDVFRRAGRPVAVCGNVGRPFSAVVDSLPPEGVAVLEVSSFQLEDIFRFTPRTAIITNFSPDHLDRYDSYGDYLVAKCRIFDNMDSATALVYNRGDEELSKRVAKAKARQISFGREAEFENGAGVLSENIIIRQQGQTRKLMPASSLALPGYHNLENALAVVCAALEMGVPDETIVASLRGFPGVAHRLEKVLASAGVLWINDSKATNLASGLVALESYSQPIILLVGGRDKGSDFAAVASSVLRRVHKVILFGEAGPAIETAWQAAAQPRDQLQRVHSLEEAVKVATILANPGDVVLLSPMCASFDEFQNYEDRGEKFKSWVRRYAQEKI